ncbi:MAG: AraC family transcriptional regulator N-terminal domain-containing protein [Gemmatimonas sp.]
MSYSSASDSLTSLLAQLAQRVGRNNTDSAAVTVSRLADAQEAVPASHGASIVIVGQGAKRRIVNDHVIECSSGKFLLSASHMPATTFVEPISDVPVLSVTIDVDRDVLRDLVRELPDIPAPPTSRSPVGVQVGEVDPRLADATRRLLDCLMHPTSSRILAPATIREIYYRILCGPHGGVLRALAESEDDTGPLRDVIRYIHEHFAGDIAICDLARLAHMSPSTFHERFKAATGDSPMQYIKSMRLAKARTLMRQRQWSAKSIARTVGYQSYSQFSREYRRRYGKSPSTAE